MTSYRFCRTDDIPLLVEAHNQCYRPASGERDELTVDRFKRLIREIDLWTSSCMVALAGDDPIAVILACKRETENWIYRIAVHAEHRRQGHGGHVLTSLSQKMAILGPPRLLAEVPESDTNLAPFFESCAYRAEGAYTDFVAAPMPEAPEPPALLRPAKLADVADLLSAGEERSWWRRPDTVRNLGDQLGGYAIASDRQIEAFALYRDSDRSGCREVLAIEVASQPGLSDSSSTSSSTFTAAPGNVDALVGMLLIQLRRTARHHVLVPRVEPREVGFELLQRCGFKPGVSYRAMSATAAPL